MKLCHNDVTSQYKSQKTVPGHWLVATTSEAELLMSV